MLPGGFSPKALAPASPSRSMPTCCGTPAATPLANAGHDARRIQDWLGHKSIAHTTRYTQLSAAPFKDFWR
jgi:integrase